MASLVAVVGAYLLGSLSFAIVVSRLLKLPDPRGYGSGNPGATNVLRSGRTVAALLTLIGDTAKGAAAVLLARAAAPHFGLGSGTIALVALAAFLGHLYPVLFGFKGGKGVATSAGILFSLNPWTGAAALAVFASVVAATRYVSLASVLAAIAAAVASVLLDGWVPVTGAVLIMAALVIWRHRSNLRRLAAGEEGKLGAR
jgi:glycerol-3-phosphate acyltransferase PlsY